MDEIPLIVSDKNVDILCISQAWLLPSVEIELSIFQILIIIRKMKV